MDGWMERWIICLFALKLCSTGSFTKKNNIKILGKGIFIFDFLQFSINKNNFYKNKLNIFFVV
jgi:hypothetical protein